MRFAFLVYVPRSGSTFLARQCSTRSSDVLLMPEFMLPLLLIQMGDAAVRQLTPHGLRRILHEDPQLSTALNLPDTVLDRLAASCAGQGMVDVLAAVVREFLGLRRLAEPRVVVLKRGALLWHWAELEAVFPDAMLVHLYRDARGTVSSMLRTIDPYAKRASMGRGQLVYGARYWRRFVTTARRIAAADPGRVLELRYEDVLASPDARVDEVLRFLLPDLADDARGTPASGDYFGISDPERAIHGRILQAAAPERLAAWQTELEPWQGVALEWLIRSEMAPRGYEPYFLPRCSPWSRRLALARAGVVHGAQTIAHGVRRAVEIARAPAHLGRRLSNRFTHG